MLTAAHDTLRQAEILAKLHAIVDHIADYGCAQCVFCLLPTLLTPPALTLPHRKSVPIYHPGYGWFSLESLPGSLYADSPKDFLYVQSDMRDTGV